MRFLATKNCFREGIYIHAPVVAYVINPASLFALVRHNVFANNRLSLLLVSSSPLPNIFLQRTSVTFGLLNEMHICLTDPEYGPSLAPEKSPFMYTVRDEGLKDFFDYLKHHVRRTTIYIARISDLMISSLIWSRLACHQSLKCRAHIGDSFLAVCIWDDFVI